MIIVVVVKVKMIAMDVTMYGSGYDSDIGDDGA